MGAGNATPRVIRKSDRAEEARKALILKRDGHTYESIGKQLGISKAKAHRLVHEHIEDIPKDAAADLATKTRERRAIADEQLQQEIRRNNRNYKSLAPRLNAGDIEAIRVDCQRGTLFLRILERHATMYGYDAPKQIENLGEPLAIATTGPAVQIVLAGLAGDDEPPAVEMKPLPC